MKGWRKRLERQLQKFDGTRSAVIEAEPGLYEPSLDELDGDSIARSVKLPSLRKGGTMAVGVESKKRRPRWERRAKKAAKAEALRRGMPWPRLTKDQKKLSVLIEGCAAGSLKAFRRLCRKLNIPVPTQIAGGPAPAPAPAPASVDGVLAKSVLGSANDPKDVAEAVAVLKACLARPTPGCSGFRR